jgi:UDP-N-acetylglucosamine 2-epimerase (non-hydrolysing)
MQAFTFVAGARPNFVKIAPLMRAAAERVDRLRIQLVHTGQHHSENMSDVFFQQLGIRQPDVHLGVGSGPHGMQTGRILEKFEQYLLQLPSPTAGVAVVGDVNSTLACALGAVKLGIPVAHIEAGLRSFDRTMPEEINRIATDAISDLLLVSEPQGEQNLLREGVEPSRICYIGNVMIDTLVQHLPIARALNAPAKYGVEGRPFCLVTLHRPGNVDFREKLTAIVELLTSVSQRLPIIFPVHPRSAARLLEFGLKPVLEQDGRIQLLGPLGYLENLSLLSQAAVVLTDSGGIQEETSYLRVPCITLRQSTERPITVTEGTNMVIGDDFERVAEVVDDCLAGRYRKGGPIRGWDGHAAERCLDALCAHWGGR